VKFTTERDSYFGKWKEHIQSDIELNDANLTGLVRWRIQFNPRIAEHPPDPLIKSHVTSRPQRNINKQIHIF